MSINTDVFLILGYSISKFNFFEHDEPEEKICFNGHVTSDLTAKFCGGCGNSLNYVWPAKRPTLDFQKYYDILGKLTCNESIDELHSILLEAQYKNDIGVWSSYSPNGSYGDEVFGICLGKTGDLLLDAKPFEVSNLEFKNAKEIVKKHRKAMNLEEESIKIYTMLYVG